MKTIVHLPSDHEVKSIKFDQEKRCFEIEHAFVGKVAPVLRTTRIDDSGAKTLGVLQISKDGKFKVLEEESDAQQDVRGAKVDQVPAGSE